MTKFPGKEGPCPVCGKDWVEGFIFDTFRKMKEYKHRSDGELEQMIE